jgi:hypothetical protein
MTKEELKEKVTNDPEARAKFLASAKKFYEDLGIGTDHEELHTLADAHAKAASRPIPLPIIFPRIIVIFPVETTAAKE